ncbi:MAG: SDR family NAD(P)-dependent oxidoreductase [Bacillota bacterium]
MKLKDKVVLITGAGSGLGRAIAVQMAQEGAKIGVNDVSTSGIEETIAILKEIGAEGLALPADVSSVEQVQEMFKKLLGAWGTIDIMVNNAGIGIPWPDYREASTAATLKVVEEVSTLGMSQESMKITSNLKDEYWHTTINIHLHGTFYCTREALKIMEEKRSGKIINMASVCGEHGCAGAPAYSAAKGAIAGFTRSVAREVAGSGIIVNAIAPGYCETPMVTDGGEEVVAIIKAGTLVGRLGTSDEIAGLAVYLASDEGNYIIGQVISPNGGMFI